MSSEPMNLERAVISMAVTLEDVRDVLSRVALNTASDALHVPIIVPHLSGDSWGVFCFRCSTLSGGPARCELDSDERTTGPSGEWPTELFPNVNSLAVRKLERIRRVASGTLMDTPAGDPRQFVAQQIIEILTTEDEG